MENKRKRKLEIIVSVLAIVVLFIGSTAYLVFWDKTPDIAENQSFNLIDKLKTLQVNGGTLELTEDELNSTFKTLLDKPMKKNGIVINGAYVDIGEKTITLFIPIKYKGMNLLPNITGSIDYENDRLNFNITSVKIGRLRIPKSLLLNKLKNYSNDDIIINENKIEISKYLLPFNAEDIYLRDNKIFAEIAKLALSQSAAANNQNNAAQQSGQNSGGTASSNSSTNVNTPNTQTTAIPPAAQVSSLNKVSGQLNGVIVAVQTDKERQMIKTIQTVVKEVAANPNYPYQGQANEVKAWYRNLHPNEKSRVKDAILNNVNAIEILKLINIFGI